MAILRPIEILETLCFLTAFCAAKNGDLRTAPNLSLSNEAVYSNRNGDSCEKHDYFSCENFNATRIENRVDILDLWNNFPKVIVPTSPSGEQCRHDVRTLLAGVENMEMWALKMIDSTAKLPSGILRGNINQYGDFDQCLSVSQEVKGKYCLSSLQVSLKDDPFNMPEMDTLLNAHYAMRSNLTDPGHRVPRYSSIMWGVCIPQSCSAKDLENELVDVLKGLNADVLVEESNCVSADDKMDESLGKKIARSLFLTLLSLLVIGTLFDSGDTPEESLNNYEKIMRAFSLKRSYSKFIDISAKVEFPGVDGIRALNAIGLLMAHKTMASFYNPYVNRTQMAEIFGMPWSVMGRTSIIYTDSFLLISGLLTTRGLLQDLEKHGKMHFLAKLRSRIFRLLPLMTAVILFCTYILPELSNGPQWKLVIEEHSRLCKANMWRNFLFIHNFYGFPPMCLTHTHQIGIDMQLFLVTPLFVWLLWNRPKLGITVAFLVGTWSTFLRYRAIIEQQMSMVVFFGISVDQLFKAANYSYTLPNHRATIYLMGILTAYFMTKKESHAQFSKILTWVFWIIAFGLGFLAQLGPWKMSIKDYKYEPLAAAMYATFTPLIWGVFISWVTWRSARNQAGWFGDFLSWRGFRLFTKMAYAFYLVQFPVFFYNVGTLRAPTYYTPQVMFEVPEVAWIMGLSLAATLCVEMPFMEVHSIIFSQRKKDVIKNGKVNGVQRLNVEICTSDPKHK